ncbi:MAG: ATP-binding cassette domain-containing protein [Deltaproteobacteria bacterium]|nr:ATP-binding cassette domain-containing protein [Deltaproteobacteria bacterium]
MIVSEELTKYYGLKPAVQDVTFNIEQGEIVGFLGPNGAGKTTILRILTCFMPPTSGKALIDGLDTRTESLKVRGKIGFLPENVPLYHDMTVNRFLGFAGSVKGLRGKELKGEIDRVIPLCGLVEHGPRIIKHLSKGLKQRVGLAQALLHDPPILILDEPTTGLDPAQIVEIRELIRNLGGDRTVLLSTHILPEVSQICQRVIIINEGRIIAEDTPERLSSQLQRQKGLRTSIWVEGPPSQVKEKLRNLEGVSQVEKTDREGEFVLESVYDENIRPTMARMVVESNWGLKEMRSMDVSLEEVFVQLVTEEEEDMES